MSGAPRPSGPWARDDGYDRVYAVGDLHGRLDLLRRMERLIGDDLGAARPHRPLVCFLGDYVDRGPDSAGVVDRLAAVVATGLAGAPVLALKGNHEARFLDFLADPVAHGAALMRFGGAPALASWGVSVPAAAPDWTAVRDRLLERMPTAHLSFLQGLSLALEWRGHLFVHAGLDPGKPLAAQTERDLLWIREPFLSATRHDGLTVVHGHVPGPEPVRRPGRIGIDTGACDTGRLTGAVLAEGTLRFVTATADGPADDPHEPAEDRGWLPPR